MPNELTQYEISTVLVELNNIHLAIRETNDIDRLLVLRNKAEAIRYAAQQAKLRLDISNAASEGKLRAERKVGEMLKGLERDKHAGPGRGIKKPNSSLENGFSEYRQVLEENDIAPTTAHRWQTVASVPDPIFERHVAETKSAGKELTTASILDVAKRQRKQERTIPPSDLPPHGELYTILHGDFRTADVDDECADWIITDPPYPAQYLPLYSDLSCFAARVLKPGGSLIVMSGQSYLPEIINRLSEHMDYHWCLSYLTPGGQAPHLFQKNVNTFWKPLLWFVKGKYEGHCIGDVCKSKPNDNDKQHHHWGQSESGMADIVERFTLPGQTIIDPFLGGGTTGVVATQLKRFFIGIDIDKSAVQESMFRLSQEN